MGRGTRRPEVELARPPSPEHLAAAALSEGADVALAVAGDTRAFERLYRLHVARIHSVVRRMVGGEADAEELTQEILVRAWERLSTYRGEAAFGTWLHRIAVNQVLNWRKGAARSRERLEEAGAIDQLPGRRHASDEAMDLEAAILRLPSGARHIFVLHDVEGFKHEEIAAMLGVTTGTTKAQLHRARMMIRAMLER